LSATLIAPDGTQVQLFANVGGTGANFTNTIFDKNAASAIGTGTAPFTGSFRPTPGSLAALNGKNFLGDWKLVITDNAAGVAGTLNGWSLNPFTVTALSARTFRVTFPTQTISGFYTL